MSDLWEGFSDFGYVTGVDMMNGFNPHKFGLTDHQMKQLRPILDEMDRNARAYGWEIGNGQEMKDIIDMHDENPFLSPNWRDNVSRTDAPPSGGSEQSGQREDSVRGSGSREDDHGSGVLYEEGGSE